ncbi:MAG: serine protease [Silvibacterium sp.]
MTKIFVPSGRLSSKKRDFSQVVKDIRHAVFSVVRSRPLEDGKFLNFCLGSGFFVSSSVFVTCWHVIDAPNSPHKEGDQYALVNNLDGTNGMKYLITGGLGKDIHLFPDLDFAVILCTAKPDQAYMPVGYSDVPVGAEIGVAGYPLASIIADENGNGTLDGLVYRVARGVATAVYRINWDSGDGHPLKNAPVIEVNFFFVPGNSGGPIFDSETGRAFAYVKGLTTPKVSERIETFTLIPRPENMENAYVASVHAVYSIGLTLERVRSQLEQFGVQL